MKRTAAATPRRSRSESRPSVGGQGEDRDRQGEGDDPDEGLGREVDAPVAWNGPIVTSGRGGPQEDVTSRIEMAIGRVRQDDARVSRPITPAMRGQQRA